VPVRAGSADNLGDRLGLRPAGTGSPDERAFTAGQVDRLWLTRAEVELSLTGIDHVTQRRPRPGGDPFLARLRIAVRNRVTVDVVWRRSTWMGLTRTAPSILLVGNAGWGKPD
jgi:hypothetical protein